MFGLGNGVANSIADTLGQDPESAGRNSFNRDFNVSNFDSFGGDVTPSKFTEIARFRVPSSTEYAFGYGRASAPDNQGYLYVDLQSATPNPVEGTFRLELQSATGRDTTVVADFDSEKLDASKTDRTQQVPLPEQVSDPVATEDSFLVIKFEANSDNTDQSIDSAESEIIVPVTEYDLG